MYDCPQCGLPSESHGYYVLPSTNGPVWHVKIRCIVGHFFNCPVEFLTGRRNALPS